MAPTLDTVRSHCPPLCTCQPLTRVLRRPNRLPTSTPSLKRPRVSPRDITIRYCIVTCGDSSSLDHWIGCFVKSATWSLVCGSYVLTVLFLPHSSFTLRQFTGYHQRRPALPSLSTGVLHVMYQAPAITCDPACVMRLASSVDLPARGLGHVIKRAGVLCCVLVLVRGQALCSFDNRTVLYNHP